LKACDLGSGVRPLTPESRDLPRIFASLGKLRMIQIEYRRPDQ